jgi:hypothetical protein
MLPMLRHMPAFAFTFSHLLLARLVLLPAELEGLQQLPISNVISDANPAGHTEWISTWLVARDSTAVYNLYRLHLQKLPISHIISYSVSHTHPAGCKTRKQTR